MSTLPAHFSHGIHQLHHTIQHHCNPHLITARTSLLDAFNHASAYPKLSLYILFLTLIIYLTTRHFSRTPSQLQSPSRPSGVIPLSPFTRPPAPPYPSWSLTHTPPLPYRPFRPGLTYHITMGLRAMHWAEWIELDNEFLTTQALKKERLRDRREKVCRTAPEAMGAAKEVLAEVGGYVCERYPSLFGRVEGGGVVCRATGEIFDLAAEDPMGVAGLLVQDDLAIMQAGLDGTYRLVAGSICLAGFWRLEDKFGMALDEIHTSGHVPGFREKLEKPMNNFFRRLTPEKPVLRNNYFIQVDDNLAWSSSIGDEDSEGVGWGSAEKNKAIQHHYFRSERQSLRRLPRTGAILFTIRTYFHPITHICKEPHVPGRLASAVRSWGDDVSRYKGRERYGDVLLEYLDRMHEEQVSGGLVVEEDEGYGAGGGYPW